MSDTSLLVAKISIEVAEIIFSGQDYFCSGLDNFHSDNFFSGQDHFCSGWDNF